MVRMTMLEYKKSMNNISFDLEKLISIIDDDDSYLEDRKKLEEIHSISWTIQLKAESMLRFLE